ncbi:MAG: GNAT family N-acetyltransferase [Chloroflexota bacterium]|nr:GNAT family N-acetyltransferase [Chloroflexota bacterium]MDE2970398.1 GNAT family N-acetyltransferase [Chloroflexota bacterium]
MTIDREHAARIVASTLAAEACCSPDLFARAGVHLSEVTPGETGDPLKRRFPQPEQSLAITAIGVGVVVSATPKWMPWVSELFRGVEPGDAFNLELLGETSMRVAHDSCRLYGPYLYSITSSLDLRARQTPDGYSVELGDAALVRSLDPHHWPNALPPRALRQDLNGTITAVAVHRQAIVGVATAPEDSDLLWQIGLDVHADHRGRGLGAALTSRVAAEVLRQGVVPYYGTTVENVISRRTAQSAGFYPYWTAAFTKARAE